MSGVPVARLSSAAVIVTSLIDATIARTSATRHRMPSSSRSISGPFADSAIDSVSSPNHDAQLRPNDTSSLPNDAFTYDSPKSTMPDVLRKRALSNRRIVAP